MKSIKIETKQMVEVDVIREQLLTIYSSLARRIAHIEHLLNSPLVDKELLASYGGEKLGLLSAQMKVLDLIYSL